MSRVKADGIVQDIFKTQIKSQEILDLLILVLEVAKVWLHHITCHWHDGNCEKKNLKISYWQMWISKTDEPKQIL